MEELRDKKPWTAHKEQQKAKPLKTKKGGTSSSHVETSTTKRGYATLWFACVIFYTPFMHTHFRHFAEAPSHSSAISSITKMIRYQWGLN
jgi:hypothetical protein